MPVQPHMDVYQLPLHSKVRRAIAQAPMESAPMKAWGDWLLAQGKNGVSQNELDYLCFPPSTGRESKDDLLEHFKHLVSDIEVLIQRKEKPRKLQLVPVNKSGTLPVTFRLDKTTRKVMPFITHHNPAFDFNVASLTTKDLLGHNELWAVLNSNGKYWKSKLLRIKRKPFFLTKKEALGWCYRVAAYLIPNTHKVLEPHVKWEYVRLEGGESYTEWLITQPHHSLRGEFKPNAHFAAKNLLMHLRTSIYPSGGKRILLIEELQSDYFQNKRRMEKAEGATLDNPFESSWVDLGLRVAVLIACRQGLDGVAISNGEMQDAVYRKSSNGRAIFYDSKVANTLKKLAKPLGADCGMATVLARTQYYWVNDSGSVPTDGCERYSVTWMRVPGHSLKSFHDYNEAVEYRESLEKTITTSVPVLWLNPAQRVSLMRLGLPVLGAVEKLPTSASPHAPCLNVT